MESSGIRGIDLLNKPACGGRRSFHGLRAKQELCLKFVMTMRVDVVMAKLKQINAIWHKVLVLVFVCDMGH